MLQFATAMSRAGNTAFDTLHWTNLLAKKMGVEASLGITLDHIIVGVYGPGETITSARPMGSPGVNSWRISELEKLAREARHGLAPRALLEELQHIESIHLCSLAR